MSDSPAPGGTAADVVPAGASTIPVVDVRHGMFGAHSSGDTSGYGGLVQPVELPGPSPRPYGGWYDQATDELELALFPNAEGLAYSASSSSSVAWSVPAAVRTGRGGRELDRAGRARRSRRCRRPGAPNMPWRTSTTGDRRRPGG